MNSIKDEIVDFLERNRVSTTEVADVLGKTGSLQGMHLINKGHYKAGIVKYIYAYDESNWPVHEQIQDIDENRIVYVDAFDCGERALFGELVSKFLLLYKKSKAIVVNGNMRDTAELYRENYPIWCKGFNPVGCFNRRPEKQLDDERLDENRNRMEGSIAVCDDAGVVIIPKGKIDFSLLDSLQAIEDQEDIWFDRLNHYKESTFQIVCEKNYIKDEEYMRLRKRENHI